MKLFNIFNSLFKRNDKEKIWFDYYLEEENKIKFSNKTIYNYLRDNISVENENKTAINYFGKKVTYKELFENINVIANNLLSLGVREKDIVSICMPNTPEVIYLFYACNKIGAVCDMIHPLAGKNEFKLYLSQSKSKFLFLVNFNYKKFKNIIDDVGVTKTILISPKESMPNLLYWGYSFFREFNLIKPNNLEKNYISWGKFKLLKYNLQYTSKMKSKDLAVILHSGGTTGYPKGIMLSNYNFNAEAQQGSIIVYNINSNDKILTLLPNFHGFGLCVCIHCPLSLGIELLLLPEYKDNSFYKVLKKEEPNVIIGVPTLWEAMFKNKKLDKVNFKKLKYIISGGDYLSIKKEEKLNNFIHQRGANINVSKGYGMTEAVAAISCTFDNASDKGSVGIPLIGNLVKVVDTVTGEEVKKGEEGEIIVSGPTVMMGYLNNIEETNKVLKKDKKGRVWLHTGDIGYISLDGLIYYTSRLKRMIVVSGFNVYPSEIENVILDSKYVKDVCVVGVFHKYKIEVPKAVIVLEDKYIGREKEVEKQLIKLCKERLSIFALPRYFDFRYSLPKTKLGKVDYIRLSNEEDIDAKN